MLICWKQLQEREKSLGSFSWSDELGSVRVGTLCEMYTVSECYLSVAEYYEMIYRQLIHRQINGAFLLFGIGILLQKSPYFKKAS